MPTPRRTRPSEDTRARILAAAEALFMEQGFTATSLRGITARAKVNLAAVNYHFGSKDALIREIFDRSLGPLNTARIEHLERMQRDAGGAPLPVERIVEAMVSPALQLSKDPLRRGAQFLRLLGRALSEPAETMREFLPAQYRDTILKFKDAFQQALPHIPEPELVWRMHFTFGAMAYAMAGNDALQLIATCRAEEGDNAEAIIRRLVPFLAAGIKGPLPHPAIVGGTDVAAAGVGGTPTLVATAT